MLVVEVQAVSVFGEVEGRRGQFEAVRALQLVEAERMQDRKLDLVVVLRRHLAQASASVVDLQQAA